MAGRPAPQQSFLEEADLQRRGGTGRLRCLGKALLVGAASAKTRRQIWGEISGQHERGVCVAGCGDATCPG